VNKSSGALGGIVLVLIALLVAGCGGSSEEALTKSEFVEQGNAICKQATKEREKAIAEFAQTGNPNGSRENLQEEAVEKALPSYEGAAEKIAELRAPKGDEAKVEAIVEGMEETVAKIHANPQSAFAGDRAFRNANKAAENYGLDDCVV